jgi:hypothetical protein
MVGRVRAPRRVLSHQPPPSAGRSLESYSGADPVKYVVSLNLKRRHLDESQRGVVGAKIAKLEHGQRQSGKFAAVPTQAEAADLLNVSERTIRTARKLLDSDTAEPELIEAVERGEIAVLHHEPWLPVIIHPQCFRISYCHGYL